MGRQFPNVSYNGIGKEERIDCLETIRRMQNPPGSTVLDVDDLCKSNRSTKEDARNIKTKQEEGKFVRIGDVFEEDRNENKRMGQTFDDRIKVDVQPRVDRKNAPNNEGILKKQGMDIGEL